MQLFLLADVSRACFSSAEEFLESFDGNTPGCLITEQDLPGMSGSDLQELIAERRYDIPVIFVTVCGSLGLGVKCLKNGAVDYIQKPFSADRVLRSVEEAIEKDRDSRRRRKAVESVKARLAMLTTRQRQVMDLVVQGFANKVIALRLGISMKTVEIHRGLMIEKMKADSVAELVRMVVALGLSEGWDETPDVEVDDPEIEP